MIQIEPTMMMRMTPIVVMKNWKFQYGFSSLLMWRKKKSWTMS